MSAPALAVDTPTSGFRRGILFVLLAHLAFTGMDTGMKALSTELAVTQILFVFFVGFSAVALVNAARGAGIRATLATRRLPLHLGRAVLLPFNIACVIIALAVLPMAEAMALGLTYPLMITALSGLFLGERVGPWRWGAVALGFVGVLIIVRPGLAAFQPEALVILAGAVMFAVYQILTKRLGTTEPSERLMLYTALVGTAVLVLPAVLDWQHPDGRQIGFLALVAVGGAAGHSLVILALQAAPASVLQPFNFAQLIWASIAGLLVFGHVPTVYTAIGGLVIVAGGLLVWWRERRRERGPVAMADLQA